MNERLVVVGNGMVGQRFVEALRARDTDGRWRVTVLAEERRPAYDRVRLSAVFDGVDAGELNLHTPDAGVDLRLGEPATGVDRARRVVTTAAGEYPYDALVLATGSYAFVPPVDGTDLPGVFVYRTLDDLAAIREHARGRRTGAVIGGGLLGLEAANALRLLGLVTSVVEFAPRLMPVQVDEAGGAMLRRYVEELDVTPYLGVATTALRPGPDGTVAALDLADGRSLDAELVVVAAGIRPRDELARMAGLPLGPRGGVLVDTACRTADERIWAVGECAAVDGVCHGLVAPGYATAEVVADRLLGGAATFPGADTATKLKLLGVDVASFGDAHGVTPGCLDVTYTDPATRSYAKLVLSDDARTLLGGVLVGDASAYPALRASVGGPLPAPPLALLAPAGGAGAGAGALPATAQVCSCNAVTRADLDAAIAGGATDVPALKACTRAGTSCGSCVPMLKQLLDAAGVRQSTALCEHFDHSRQELFDLIRVRDISTFSRLVAEHGRGSGCDICKPVVASILASLGTGHVLDGEQASLQDTNDHFLANLQRDGSYSVVPRIPGGEITPEKLIAIGEVARDFRLYTKITGGQRIDLFGARVDQLPQIWRRLVDAGFESGHAYGKALRTVKSCVGDTWCRYGVQDSVGLAVALELRYRGLRAPHKLKSAVSGCARECAEARSKDFGVIATETGWNLYVGGNGGFRPRHADLFATDLSTAELVTLIDRFLMYYIRTADRLQRTAAWIEAMDGGLDHLRSVLVDDSLGLCADLDAAMARHVTSYSDEWRDVLEDPDRLRRFTSFVNAPEVPDPSITFTQERGQPVPARGAPPDGGHRRQPVALGLPEVRR
ncbi:nitrite reductase large subunit NirB [Micromonospora aurantiaca (nom. illeg.)]|uniref:nitrite reductase large subunit NirB n=1 Tax=Micromonospora aurantiaca (nom. illeg.) TaxID=47850 RepID=UPI0001BF52E3|nr:nitrite reductase large subunit NirB [Micromonospora aurantiaca]ADL48974.1 nitrite reductase (NAD(P)H), large subunit [Micromonospora aurantiaca ATCC 27029]